MNTRVVDDQGERREAGTRVDDEPEKREAATALSPNIQPVSESTEEPPRSSRTVF